MENCLKIDLVLHPTHAEGLGEIYVYHSRHMGGYSFICVYIGAKVCVYVCVCGDADQNFRIRRFIFISCVRNNFCCYPADGRD